MNIHIDMHQPRKQQYKTRMCFKTTVFKKKKSPKPNHLIRNMTATLEKKFTIKMRLQ